MKDFFTALGCLALGGFVVYEASGYPRQRGVEMHPGHYPGILGYIMLGLGAALLIKYLLKGSDKSDSGDGADRGRVALLVACIIAYAAAMESVGYAATTFLFIAFAVRLFHGSVKVSLVTGLAASLALTIVFRHLFHSPVPSGFLF